MRDALIEFPWADDDHRFRLGWGELIQLQEACDAGPYVILERLTDGTWRMQDISHTIRLGLIGGGMEPTAALKLVKQYVEKRPPAENLMQARAILSAGCVGAPEEDLGKKARAAVRKKSTTSHTGRSGSLPSTEPAP